MVFLCRLNIQPFLFCCICVKVRITRILHRSGVVDDAIFFTLESLQLPFNYVPRKDDVVNLVAVESSQSLHQWRAICIAPAEKERWAVITICNLKNNSILHFSVWWETDFRINSVIPLCITLFNFLIIFPPVPCQNVVNVGRLSGSRVNCKQALSLSMASDKAAFAQLRGKWLLNMVKEHSISLERSIIQILHHLINQEYVESLV